jgi:hypothetical protein
MQRTLIRNTLRLAIAVSPLTLCSCTGGQLLLIPTGFLVRGAASAAAFAAAAVWLLLLARMTAPAGRPTSTASERIGRRLARTRAQSDLAPRTLATPA